jgi:hypothetical protein
MTLPYNPFESWPLSGSERADERTRTADLPSLRVINHVLQGFARACNTRIDKRRTLLLLAVSCTVLRSRWCQSGVRNRPHPLRVPHVASSTPINSLRPILYSCRKAWGSDRCIESVTPTYLISKL